MSPPLAIRQPVLSREIKMAGIVRGMRKYNVQYLVITANTTPTVELPLGILRGTHYATGNMICGASDCPRVVGDRSRFFN